MALSNLILLVFGCCSVLRSPAASPALGVFTENCPPSFQYYFLFCFFNVLIAKLNVILSKVTAGRCSLMEFTTTVNDLKCFLKAKLPDVLTLMFVLICLQLFFFMI